MVDARHPFLDGERVVCINAKRPLTSNRAPTLLFGYVYTVESARWGKSAIFPEAPPVAGIRLVEASFPTDIDDSWQAARFISLDEWGARD